MNKTAFGRNLVRKQFVQLMLCKTRRKMIWIQIADVSSMRQNCNISVSTQGIDLKFSGNLKN